MAKEVAGLIKLQIKGGYQRIVDWQIVARSEEHTSELQSRE